MSTGCATTQIGTGSSGGYWWQGPGASNTTHDVTAESTTLVTDGHWPYVAATNGLGEAGFWQLRRQAQTQLGSSFGPKAFLNAGLELGAVSFSELQHVQQWLRQVAPTKPGQ